MNTSETRRAGLIAAILIAQLTLSIPEAESGPAYNSESWEEQLQRLSAESAQCKDIPKLPEGRAIPTKILPMTPDGKTAAAPSGDMPENTAGFRGPAPPLTLQHLTGKTIDFPAAYAGKFVLLEFWYASCYWCSKAVPHIKQIQDRFAHKNLVFVAINTSDSIAKMREFAQTHDVNYPILFDLKTKGDLPSIYKFRGVPSFFIINPQGEIVRGPEFNVFRVQGLVEQALKDAP